MPDMSLKKHEMPSQEPKVRAKNFDEVALGYDLFAYRAAPSE